MNKLEKHIKQKLEQRELQPSENAWNKIEAQLESVNAKPKPYAKWYAVAAVFLGTVLALSLFWTSDAPIQKNTLVETNDKAEEPLKTDDKEDVFKSQLNSKQKRNEDNLIQHKKEELVFENPKANELLRETVLQDNSEDVQPILFEENTAKTVQVLENSKIEALDIDKKIESILAHVNAMEKNAITVSDAEIDSLLMAAQRELLVEQVFQKNESLDAMALLNEVELELYDDAANPLFKKLKEGFFKLRTAVANKN